jgi:hypothetical protein
MLDGVIKRSEGSAVGSAFGAYLKLSHYPISLAGNGPWAAESIFPVIRSPQTRGSGMLLPGKWKVEATFPVRRMLIPLVLFIVLGIGGLVWLRMRDASAPISAPAAAPPAAAATAAPIMDKQPPVVSTRRFDPAAPPPDMPPLRAGEQAQCDSSFASSALVSGQTRRTGATSATLTVTRVKMNLQLGITIWIPDAVTQKVLEHEEGHRQISEFYYRDADKLAGRIAASYIGRQYEVAGADIVAAGNNMLQQVGADITAEYSSQIQAESAQLRYDAITDHARNDVLVSDAVAQVTIR